jgi:two-component system OmpR family sensor kinase
MTTMTTMTAGTTTVATTERRWRPSARLRILGWSLALTALAVAGALLLSWRLLRVQLDAEVNDHLRQELEEVRSLARGRDPETGRPFGADVEAIFQTFLRRNVPQEGEAYYTFVVGGRVRASQGSPVPLYEDPGAGQRWAALTRSDQGELATEAGPVRWMALPLHNAEGETLGVFVVANFLQSERDEIAEVMATGFAVGGGVLVVAAVVGWLVAGRILRPLREVTETARAISETNLAARIDVEGDDEIATLARTFNAMLDRLQVAFATQRSFVDDAGHELRTPITIVRGHLELLDVDPDERAETVALVTDELDRMSRIVDDLLLLAKLEQPDFLRLEQVEVEPFTLELFAKAKALGAGGWQLGDTAVGPIVADPQRLTQAVMNLARNALEHGGRDTTITLGSPRVEPATTGTGTVGAENVAVAAGEVAFWVTDTGPGIAPGEQEAIFERFARGGDGRRRSEGAGLGLAIVRAVAEAHGGRVTLDSRPGAGSRFAVVIPTSPPRRSTTPAPENNQGRWRRSTSRRTGRSPWRAS